MKRTDSAFPRSSAFTLMEILVVVLIVSLILALTAPAINDSLNASRLTASGDELVALLSEAQQIVSTEGVALEVQFLKHPPADDPAGLVAYRTMLLLRRYEKGQPSPEPARRGSALEASMTMIIGAAVTLPSGFVLSENTQASTLLATSTGGGGGGSGGSGSSGASATPVKILRNGTLNDYQFPQSTESKTGFVLRSEGTNLNSSSKWFVTLVKELDEQSGQEPANWKNFYCIQVNPVTGGITSYRP